MNGRSWVSCGLLYLLAAGSGVGGQAPTADRTSEPQLAQHRNLGKAFYENPTTKPQAVVEFEKALALAPESARERVNYGLALLRAGRTAEGIAELERAQRQDPTIPHTWFNLGIAFKRDGRFDLAIAQFEQMVRLVPEEPVSHYNLGTLYRSTDRSEDALREFELAARLDPSLAGPHFQLFGAYRAAGRAADAAREQALFQERRKQQAGAAVPEDLEWSYYAEIFDPLDRTAAVDAAPAAALRFDVATVATALDPTRSGLLVVDMDGDATPELLAWGGDRVRMVRHGAEPAVAPGFADLADVRGLAAGDYDNDGAVDLAVLTGTAATLYQNVQGVYRRSADQLPDRAFVKAVWIDYDHDYDLDLLLLGPSPALMRNNGRAGFSDQTAAFPFVPGRPTDAVAFTLVADTAGRDLAVSYEDRAGVIYRDLLGGKYEPQSLEPLRPGVRALAAEDIDYDGEVDLVSAGSHGRDVLLNRGKGWEVVSLPGAAPALALADVENRALTDLVVDGAVLRNNGEGRFVSRPLGLLDGVATLAAADFDGDGQVDLAALGTDGRLQLLSNRTATPNQWLRIALTGVKNPRLAQGALVEVKAGVRYQKKAYDGVPILFGLRDSSRVDTVRITWPNGLIQNETEQQGRRLLAVKEAQRLSGSCPMIFTWNGRGFEFITDVLGVAPLGASAGDGSYFPVDHDEYVQIPGTSLVARDGAYEVRLTEELREVSYLDQIQLIALDHPAAVDVFTNDKFKSPPFPEFRLFGAKARVHPSTARDDGDRDVRPTLLRRDRIYPTTFARDLSGVAALHTLDLDFGSSAADGRAVLVLNGWVDWPDGSTFRAAAQEDAAGLVFPSIQVQDARGQWVRVVDDMGIPAGKPKTIAVDMTGKFLSASRAVRIVTNLCIYWDEIFLVEGAEAPPAVLTPLTATVADLSFRGFSQPTIHPERAQPEWFNYDQVSTVSMWNPTPGRYTRYGDVRELVEASDDRMVIMGSGDELRLQFSAGSLPELKAGWVRDFLLFVDGWAKDGDANTAFSGSVEPLPFHGMTAYPYPSPEHFPNDQEQVAYQREYNTRPALRLLRPLDGAGTRGALRP